MGMTAPRRVGLDLGLQMAHRGAIYDGAERVGRSFSVEVSRDGFDGLLRRATDGVDGPVTFVLEPTGLAWMPVAAYVSAAGHKVMLATPQKTSALRKFLRSHVKSDAVDAGVAARLPDIDPEGVHLLRVPTAQEMALSRLVKRRERLVRQATKVKQRVEALMVMVNPPLMSALGSDKFTRAAQAFFVEYADPETVVSGGLKTLEQFWRRQSRGQADMNRADKVFAACQKTAELYRELRAAGELPFDYAQVQRELETEIDELRWLETQTERAEEQIKVLYAEKDPYRTLQQLAGVGAAIAPALEALSGNVLRFANGRRYVSYCGLAPRKKQSGQSNPSMPITKAGPRLLKKYLYLAADVARIWDVEFAAYYARRYARGDAHQRIVVALARKLAIRVYTVLKRRDLARLEGNSERAEYVLRDLDGNTISNKAARELVRTRHARAVVAPERDRRDRVRHGKPVERRAPRNGVAAVETTPQMEPNAGTTIGSEQGPEQPATTRCGVDEIERN